MRRKLIRPTEAEDTGIAIGIAADSDTCELTDAEFAELKSVRGRPRLSVPKKRVTIRLSSDVVETFRAAGRGWQTRVDLALRDRLKTHCVP